jgi:hypothetical protein
MRKLKVSKERFNEIEISCPPIQRWNWARKGYKRYVINGYKRMGIYIPRDDVFYYI